MFRFEYIRTFEVTGIVFVPMWFIIKLVERKYLTWKAVILCKDIIAEFDSNLKQIYDKKYTWNAIAEMKECPIEAFFFGWVVFICL